MKHIAIIALLFAFVACKKDESAQKSVIPSAQYTGTYASSVTGGNSSHTSTGYGDMVISYSNGRYYAKSTRLYFWSIIDSAEIVFSGNTFTIPTHTEDSVNAFYPTAYVVINGYGSVTDTVLSMHYTVDQYMPVTPLHSLFVYDLVGYK